MDDISAEARPRVRQFHGDNINATRKIARTHCGRIERYLNCLVPDIDRPALSDMSDSASSEIAENPPTRGFHALARALL
jgi:hypothetical protein